MLLDVAVAAEQLDAVGADLRPALGAQPAGERHLAGEALALVDPGGGAVGRQPHPLELDRDVRHHERHRLAVGDRLAERLALVDVGDDVVEHRLAGADRQRAPAEAARLTAAAYTSGSPSPSSAPAGSDTDSNCSEPVAAARIAHRRLGRDGDARRSSDSTTNSAGPVPSSSAATTNSSESAARGTSDFVPSSTKPSPSRRAVVRSANGSNSGARLVQRDRRRRHVLADERRAGRWPAGRRRPTG